MGHLDPVFNAATLQELVSTGTVNGTSAAGGILGKVTSSPIPPTLTHLRGEATVGNGPFSGGLVGQCGNGSWGSGVVTGPVSPSGHAVVGQAQFCMFNDVFFDSQVVGPGDATVGVTGLTTANAQTASSYPPGSFPGTVWTVGGGAYPVLVNVPAAQ